MRALLFAFAVSLCSTASAQMPGGVWVAGPYQPSPWGGYYRYNPSAPPYRGPLALQYGYGFDDDYATALELRRIRRELEYSRPRYRR